MSAAAHRRPSLEAPTLLGLDHVNLRTANVELLRAFYVDVLGLRPGPRPCFSFGGMWLYCSDAPVVHLVEVDHEPPPSGDLRLEHFALRARGLAEFLARLSAHGVPVSLGFVLDFGICQVNVRDPHGTHVHIDFDIAEARALDLVPS
jgi:catechol 2,3-dioxygenase-like lactoylglutathione lyase family enzyme